MFLFFQFAPPSTPAPLCIEVSRRLESLASCQSLVGTMENENQFSLLALAAKMRALGGQASEAIELYVKVSC